VAPVVALPPIAANAIADGVQAAAEAPPVQVVPAADAAHLGAPLGGGAGGQLTDAQMAAVHQFTLAASRKVDFKPLGEPLDITEAMRPPDHVPSLWARLRDGLVGMGKSWVQVLRRNKALCILSFFMLALCFVLGFQLAQTAIAVWAMTDPGCLVSLLTAVLTTLLNAVAARATSAGAGVVWHGAVRAGLPMGVAVWLKRLTWLCVQVLMWKYSVTATLAGRVMGLETVSTFMAAVTGWVRVVPMFGFLKGVFATISAAVGDDNQRVFDAAKWLAGQLIAFGIVRVVQAPPGARARGGHRRRGIPDGKPPTTKDLFRRAVRASMYGAHRRRRLHRHLRHRGSFARR
jgi:hypothetical protein